MIVDADVSFAQKWFGGRVADRKWSDPTIVAEAWRLTATIVSANGGDFVRRILEHQRSHPCTPDACHDMTGLIVIPNHEFKAQNAIDAVARRRGLRAGIRPLTIDDVNEYNLYAKYHADGTVQVGRFPLCPYREDANEMPAWYLALRIVRRN